MIVLIGERLGLAPEDAYMFCSLAVDMRVTQLVDGNKGIHAMLPKRSADARNERAIYGERADPPSAILGSPNYEGAEDAGSGGLLGGGREPRRRRRRQVFLRGTNHRRLLPAGLRVT